MIVNRGWLPRELLDAHMARDKKEDDMNVSFIGVLRHGEVVCTAVDITRCLRALSYSVALQRNRFTPDNDPEHRHFFYVDQRELADAMGVASTDLPVMVDALGRWIRIHMHRCAGLTIALCSLPSGRGREQRSHA